MTDSMNTSTDAGQRALKPCPFCGERPRRNGRHQSGGVICSGQIEGHPLHYIQTYGATQEEADEAWNERADHAAFASPVTPAAATIPEGMLKPFEHYDGDLPDYDHPLRCVFESGVEYAVDLLAKTLDVTDYDTCDGTEEYDGDLGGTMFNIVLAAMPTDENGDHLHPSEVREALNSPIPPATIPGGEREVVSAIVGAHVYGPSHSHIYQHVTLPCADEILKALASLTGGAKADRAIDDAVDILCRYADYIRTVEADEIEWHPYLPLVEDAIARLAALTSTGEASDEVLADAGDVERRDAQTAMGLICDAETLADAQTIAATFLGGCDE